jgi:gliding motility-associated-like protein
MKYIFSILFISVGINLLSQQNFELCNDESKTVTFYSETTSPGLNTWTINGQVYSTEQLTYTFSNPGTYNITLRRDNVICYSEETYQVTVTECPGIIYWVPNSFTPDHDEHNQTFGPVMSEGYDVNDFSFLVFNRWGELIWESKDPTGRWDGTYSKNKCQDGIYFWKLTFNVFGNDQKIENNGHISLIR